MTIHQPSWALLKLVDRIQLLARGKVYYEGPPSDMLAWFNSIGYEVPEGVNPADHYITIAENLDGSEQGESRVQKLIEAWATKDEGARATAGPSSRASSEESVAVDTLLDAYKVWPTPWLGEIYTLTQRNMLQLVRHFLKRRH